MGGRCIRCGHPFDDHVLPPHNVISIRPLCPKPKGYLA